jgi:putative hydrolase of HD superfamily
MSEVDGILDFMIEIERLKSVVRKGRPVGTKRYENSAEHSWHVCLSALVLKDHANEAIDIDRVIRMLLIHDLGEIDADDTIVYSSEKPELKAKEAAGVKRLLNYLPESTRDEYMSLWYEFEAGQTADSKYARAIDRVPPLLQNLNDDGHAWKKHGITKEQVFGLNARIGLGSETLWNTVKARLQDGVEKGILR